MQACTCVHICLREGVDKKNEAIRVIVCTGPSKQRNILAGSVWKCFLIFEYILEKFEVTTHDNMNVFSEEKVMGVKAGDQKHA